MTPDFPNIRHLRAFVKTAELGNISHAAEAVALSQPAVTHAISNLEKSLQTPLFVRLHKGMGLTDAGRAYHRRAARALGEIALGAKGGGPFEHRVTAPQLRALLSLAEARSFSLAARNLGISQPSVHRAGRDLERSISRPLFIANGQGIELTAAAENLLRHVRLAAHELQQGVAEIAALQGTDTARITIGSLPLVRTQVLPQAIHNFLQQRPFVQIATVEGAYSKLLRDLRHGQTDFLIGALRNELPELDIIQEPLFKDTLALVVRHGHPLTQTPNITLADTLEYPWVAPPKQTPAGTYLSNMLQIPMLANTPVKVVSSSLILLRGLLLAGDYMTIISTSQAQHELDTQTLVALPIELPDSARMIGLTYRKTWEPTVTQSLLLDIIRKPYRVGMETGL